MLHVAKQDPERIHRKRWATLLVLCVSLVVIVLDNTIVNVAIPTLAKPTSDGGLAASASEIQWIIDAYAIVFAGLLLSAGSLGDRFGRYKALSLGLVIFGAGSVVAAFAPSASALITARAIMGLGAAFIMPSTLSILTNVFTDPKERANAIGAWAGTAALGIGIGPITGGFLLDHFWWGSIFLVNIPVVAGGLVAGYFLVPESRDPATPKLDFVGAGLSIVGLTALIYAIIEAPHRGWGSGLTIGMFVFASAVLATFMVWEIRSSHPMLDLNFFKNPRFSASCGAITLTFFSLFGTVLLLTQYVQTVLGFSTVKAGAILLPLAAVMFVFAPLSAIWVRFIGSKIVVAFGLFASAASLALFATLEVGSSTLHVILITMLLGFGMANVMAPATECIMGSLPRAKAGVGSAVNDTTREVGGALGVAVLGSIMSSVYGNKVADSLVGVDPNVVDQASDNVGQAVGFALNAPIPDELAAQVIRAAQESFVSGLHIAAIIAGVVTTLAAVGVLFLLPSRGEEHEDNIVDLGDPPDSVAAHRQPGTPAVAGASTAGDAALSGADL
ncbi:MAG: DHA2 family efflux MFS transporter permease subunit [Acidimicrobiia bacterium]